MDPTLNPFAPGAGTAPPELAGRDALLEAARVALVRKADGRHAKGQFLLGLRGVGKTVLLNRIAELAEEARYEVVSLEAPEERGLAEILVPPLRKALFRLSRAEATKQVARQALSVLRSFAGAFKVTVGDIEFSVEPELGTADSGDLESDLPDVFLAIGQAAKASRRPFVILIDEVQYLSEPDLAALIVSMHKVGQKGLPVLLFGAGLPQLAALAGEAKSYAERLFDFPPVGPLTPDAAREAIRAPVLREGAEITDDALQIIIDRTEGYPYFLQEWGARVWDVAPRSPITDEDAARATSRALDHLDQGFFRVRLDRLTPREKDYVRAMAELGAGPHRSGDIAKKLGIAVNQAAPLRNGLIKKGMIYSPQHGDTAFTVPLFDDFMRRTMSEWKPPDEPPHPKRSRTKRAKSR